MGGPRIGSRRGIESRWDSAVSTGTDSVGAKRWCTPGGNGNPSPHSTSCSSLTPRPATHWPTTSGSGSDITPYATIWDQGDVKNLAKMAEGQGAVGIGPCETLAALEAALQRGIAEVRAGKVCVVDAIVAPEYARVTSTGLLRKIPGS